MKKRIHKLLNKFSSASRHQKALLIFKEKQTRYLSMNEDEFTFIYVELLARYEHKKILLSAIAVVWITSIFMNVWQCFLEVVIQIGANSTTLNEAEAFNVLVYLVITVGGAIFLIGLVILITSLNNLFKLTKEKLILENIKEKR